MLESFPRNPMNTTSFSGFSGYSHVHVKNLQSSLLCSHVCFDNFIHLSYDGLLCLNLTGLIRSFIIMILRILSRFIVTYWGSGWSMRVTG